MHEAESQVRVQEIATRWQRVESFFNAALQSNRHSTPWQIRGSYKVSRPGAVIRPNLRQFVGTLLSPLHRFSPSIVPGEIERCLKKVSEGVETFEDIWKKVCVSSSTPLVLG